MEDLKKAKLLQESEGAKLVFFAGEKYPPLMIEKKDGATLYATRDLATDKFRRKEYGADIMVINEVGSEQSLYFKQLFEVEEVLGYFKKSQRVHIAHGFIRFKDGKMSTRKGNVIWLEDIIDEAYTRASKFNPDPKVAEAVAIGAIKFNDLKRESSQDIIFDWDEMLNLTGDSCPYLQYSHARAASVLAKAKEEGIDVSAITQKTGDSGIGDASVLEKIIYRFPEIVERSATDYQPHHIATYLLELAAVFSSFYAIAQIVDKKDPTSPYRVALTQAFEIVMKNGLTLLGIASPEKM
jgi:arginyl-tRNA synthetase